MEIQGGKFFNLLMQEADFQLSHVVLIHIEPFLFKLKILQTLGI